MPGYNPWDAFDQGGQIGEGMLATSNRRRLGDAYTDGGLDAMEQEAFGQGDARTGMATRQFQNEQEAEVYNRMRRARNFVVPAIRRSLNLPPEQARQFLTQPHFMQRYGTGGLGLDDATLQRGLKELTSEDPSVRRAAADRIVNGFEGVDGPDWQVMGRTAVAVQPDGQFQIGGTLPESVQSGQWRAATPEEMQTLPPGTEWDINVQTGERRMRYRPNAPRAGQGGGSYEDDGYDYEGG